MALSYSESVKNNYMEDGKVKTDFKKTMQAKKMISLGLLLGVTTFIALGAAAYHMIDQPNTANAEKTEESYHYEYDVPSTTEKKQVAKEKVKKQEEKKQEEKKPVIEEVVVEEPQAVEEVVVQEEQNVVEEVVVAEEPQVTEEVVVQEAQASPAASAMTLNILGNVINYQNGGMGSGQSIIDGNPSGIASTWGGSSVQSGTDGMNTHFIGHNPGVFNVLFSLAPGNAISITDANGATTVYTVRTILTLDDYGMETSTGEDYYDFVTGSGGGERVTFQTCITNSTNLIVAAYA